MKATTRSLRLLALTGAATLAGLSSARAQNVFVTNGGNSTVGDYNISSGTGVAVPFAPAGINGPIGIALSGSTLYVGNSGTGLLNSYNAVTGASLGSFSAPNDYSIVPSGGNLYIDNLNGSVSLVNATTGAAVTGFTTITSGLNQPTGLALLGNTLYVNNTNNGGGAYVNTYNATTGTLLTSHLAMNLGNANYIAAAGNALYVASYGNNLIYGFNATTGAALAGFTTVSDPGSPDGLTLYNGNLYATNLNTNTVSEYSATTGALVNATVASGLNSANDLAIGAVPEPSTWAATLLAVAGLLGLTLRRRVRRA